MRPFLTWLLAVCLCAQVRGNAFGDDAPAPEPPAPVAATEDTPGAMPLESGEAAPFDGVLLPEAMMMEYLKQEAELIEAEWRIEVRDRALDQLQGDLALAKTRSSAPRPSFWAGVALGVGATMLLIWGTANALDTVK